jgi:hypothetical protein
VYHKIELPLIELMDVSDELLAYLSGNLTTEEDRLKRAVRGLHGCEIYAFYWDDTPAIGVILDQTPLKQWCAADFVGFQAMHSNHSHRIDRSREFAALVDQLLDF